MVGTFHAYSTKRMPNRIANLLGARRKFNQLSARIAVSEAAAWTGRRWFGGEYRVIPNGVDVDAAARCARSRAPTSSGCCSSGGPEERKGLPVLLQAFEGLIEHVPARLTVIGAERRGRAALPRRSGRASRGSRRSAGSPATSSGATSTRPTCSARPRSRARASAWS